MIALVALGRHACDAIDRGAVGPDPFSHLSAVAHALSDIHRANCDAAKAERASTDAVDGIDDDTNAELPANVLSFKKQTEN